jgi:CheY-like chemotaxis protein
MNQSKIIWIVDDTYEDLYIAQMILKKICPEFIITVFQNPETAYRQLLLNHEHHQPMPDVILLDLRMPVMSGFDFIESMIQQIPHPPPVLILTSSADENDVLKAKQYEIVKRFFTKPLNKDMAGQIRKTVCEIVTLVFIAFVST